MAHAEPLATERTSLYERDFVLWLEQQAVLLRERRFDDLDVANLVEEIESMGRSEKRAIKSNLVVVLLHLLKHQFQPAQRSASWVASILEHRQRLRDEFEDSPSLRNHAGRVFGRAYTDARVRAQVETGLPPGAFPTTCPYTLDETLDPDFLPD